MCTERQVTEVGKRGRLVCLCWFFWLLAFTGAFGAVILYDHNDGQAYGRILAELTGDEVQGQPSSQLLRWLESWPLKLTTSRPRSCSRIAVFLIIGILTIRRRSSWP